MIGIFGDPGHDRALAVGLSRVLFPIVALLGVSGIVVGILNSYDHFTVPALSPVFWNVAIIAGLAIGVPQAHSMNTKLYVYAVSILVATLIQVFLPMPWLRGRDGRLQLVLDWRDPAVGRMFELMIPVTLGLGLINVNAVIDTFFASRLINADLAPTAIQKAFLVYMLPQGMFSVAIATVLFPRLSRLAARADMDAFRSTVGTGLRQIAFLLVPTAIVSAVLAEPIIRILFQHGHWRPEDTPVVADALAAFSAGLVFNGAMLMLNRAFFSLQSNWVPTAIALGNLFLNALLDFAFYRVGVWGIPLATAVCNVAGAWALIVLLRRRLGRIDGGALASATIRVLIGGALAAVSAASSGGRSTTGSAGRCRRRSCRSASHSARRRSHISSPAGSCRSRSCAPSRCCAASCGGEVGFIGLGAMGSGIVRRLIAAGHEVTGWNRTAREGDVARRGGDAARRDAARHCRGRRGRDHDAHRRPRARGGRRRHRRGAERRRGVARHVDDRAR